MEADRIIRFIETFCTLGGSFSGQPFILLPWMKDLIRDMYEPSPDGTRRHREYLLGVPRKNAKTTLAAALAVYHLIADPHEKDPLVLFAASTGDQARLGFDEAKRMILSSPDLAAECNVLKDSVTCAASGGVMKPVNSKASSGHGLNPSFVVLDEFHVFQTDDLYSALSSGSGMRKSALFFMISTAGWDIDAPFGAKYQTLMKVKSGELVDPSFGGTWYGPTDRELETIDIEDPEVWRRFNPSFDLMTEADFRSSVKKMSRSDFIRYRLNGWTKTRDAWLPAGAWDARAEPLKAILPEDPVILAFDGSFSNDSTALVGCRISDLHVEVFGCWEKPDNADAAWRVPMQEVLDKIRDVCKAYTVTEILADPYLWEYQLQLLDAEGLPILRFSQQNTTMTPATTTAFEAITGGEMSHSGDITLARHVENVVIKQTPSGPRLAKVKDYSSRKIDLAIAMVMALSRARLHHRNTVVDDRSDEERWAIRTIG